LALIVVCANAAAAPPGDMVADILARFDRALDCDHKKAEAWCTATRGFAAGTAPADVNAAYPGVTIGLERDKPDADMPRGLVTFSTIVVKKGLATITDIPPQNASEQKLLDEARDLVLAAIVKREPVSLPKALFRYIDTIPAKHPIDKGKDEWRIAGVAAARVRRAGDYLIAVEIPPSGNGPAGIFVSIFIASAEKLPH